MNVIEVHDLRKSYGDNEAVRGVTLEVAKGEVYGLLGQNGAGKSTIVEILEGHRTPTSGTVRVLGEQPDKHTREFRDRIGIVLQSMAIDKFLTVRETLNTYAAVYTHPRPIDEVIELVGLTEKADDRVRSLSGGQQRRVDLGIGIVGNPEVLFLDEPTTGFDPVARRQSWDLIRRLCDGGTTVLLTTHYLDEAEHLAGRVGVLSHGLLVAEGTPAELTAQMPQSTISFEVPVGTAAEALGLPDGASIEGQAVKFDSDHPTADLAIITAAAISRGFELIDLRVHRPNLEDVFIGMGDDATVGGDPVSGASVESQEMR